MAKKKDTAAKKPAEDGNEKSPAEVELTAPQAKIVARLHEENGTHTAKATGALLSTLDALEKKGVVTYEKDEEAGTVTVTLVVETKGNRPVWNIALARDAEGNPVPRNDKGRLTGIPTNFPKGHYGLTVKQFANRSLWLRWKATEAEKQAAALQKRADAAREKADDLRQRAEEAEKGVSPERMLERIRAKRERMQKKLADEEAAILAKIEAGDDSDLDDESDDE